MNYFEQLRDLISDQTGIEKESIFKNSHLQDDLNLDPLSIADIVVSLENRFKIKINQEDIVKFNTISDIVEFIEDQSED